MAYKHLSVPWEAIYDFFFNVSLKNEIEDNNIGMYIYADLGICTWKSTYLWHECLQRISEQWSKMS